MTRHIVVGNQRVLINLDNTVCMRDLYFPHVGQENHVIGNRQKIGVYTDHISWISSKDWSRNLQCDTDTMINNSSVSNPKQNVELEFCSFVDVSKDVFIRRIKVKNKSNEDRRISLFFYHNFNLYGDGIGDTNGFDPVRKSIFSYKRNRYILMSTASNEELAQKKCSVSTYNISQHYSPSWIDAEDGHLSRNPIAQGDVDSCFGKHVDVPANGEEIVWYIMCLGDCFEEVHALQDYVLEQHPETLLNNTNSFEHEWVSSDVDFGDLSEEQIDLYKRSLLVIRTQTDFDGAILAGNDSDNMNFNKDTYSYLWPRDGALVAIGLDRAGKRDLTEKYFRFSADLLYEEGCFLHKYNPDGSLGSSWQAWIREGEPHLPIQEDETALQLHALWMHHEKYNSELFRELYDSFIVPAADFLVNWWHDDLGITKESWTLWEDRINISAWTCASKWAGLMGASRFANLMGDHERAQKYENRANDVKASVEKHLYSDEVERFISAVTIEKDGIRDDLTMEASMVGLWMFGMFSPTDPRIIKMMTDLEKSLWVPSIIGGLSRNEKDWFHYSGDGFRTVKGNPWLNTTMWLSKYKAAIANSPEELKKSKDLLDWILYRKLATGILPEQVHPFTGDPIGVCPLTWSHAEYVDAVHWYLDAYHRMNKK